MQALPVGFQGYHSLRFDNPLHHVSPPYEVLNGDEGLGGLVIPHRLGVELLLKDELDSPNTIQHFVDSLACADGRVVTLESHKTVPIDETILGRLSRVVRSIANFFGGKLPVSSSERLQDDLSSQLEEFHRNPAVHPPILEIPESDGTPKKHS